MKDMKNGPITVGPRDGKSLSVIGGACRILVGGKDTGGDYATIELLVPPGGGPPPHSHSDFSETLFVVDGEVEVKSEAGAYIAQKGSYVVIPKGGVVHNFKNKSDQMARLLCTVVPAGLEDFFEELGKPVKWGEFLPPPHMDREGIEKLTALFKKYGQKIFPPDYLE